MLSRLRLLLVLSLYFCTFNLWAAEDLLARIQALTPLIGSYPPNLPDDNAKRAVTQRYEALKAELDRELSAHPDALEVRYQRGYLQALGHNFDYPQAWKGASDDLRAVLRKNPQHLPALLQLGQLWVNSDLTLAGKAEQLFRAAQCIQGETPLEDAQRGLFFAFYYQGKMRDAYLQGQYLTKTWPENRQYLALYNMVRSVLKRTQQTLPTDAKIAISCEPGDPAIP